MKDMYVYAYFNDKKIPDTTSLNYVKDEGYVDVVITALPDVFPDWYRNLEALGSLALRMDNVGLSLLEFEEVRHDIVNISSDVVEFTEIILRFYVD